MSGPRPSRRGWSIATWPIKLRAAYHVALGIALIGLVVALEAAGFAWRKAVHHGNPLATGWRTAIRDHLPHPDAVPALEHLATGMGCALIGFALLQCLFYAGVVADRGQPFKRMDAGQWVRCVLIVAVTWVCVGALMYPGTRVIGGGVVALGLVPVFAWPNWTRRVALEAPQWVIGLFGAAAWFVDDLSWKAYHVPRVHQAPAIVAVQLGLGFVGLVLVSGWLGRIARRTAWLHPTPIGG
ncbi:hypothetical protein [Burkholderia contaminans]|uniref:hypothetical protein n=1 Tax=Burkholderia contaminans TaxID=488447 RepID=UPI003D66CE0F